MSIRPDRWIREMCRTHGMIEPFEEKQVREGVISFGVSSYGYDIRIADEFKIFTNVNSTIVDPKNMDAASTWSPSPGARGSRSGIALPKRSRR